MSTNEQETVKINRRMLKNPTLNFIGEAKVLNFIDST